MTYDDWRMTGRTDAIGGTWGCSFDFANRADVFTLADGSTVNLDPYQRAGLVNRPSGVGSAANPSPVYRPADIFGKIIDALGRTSTFICGSPFGYHTKDTDTDGNVTLTTRNSEGNPTNITLPHATSGGANPGFQYSFTYDAKQNLASLTYPDTRVVTFSYDATFSQVTSTVDEVGRRTDFVVSSGNGNTTKISHVIGDPDTAMNGQTDDLITQVAYTAAGLLDTRTDPLGRVTDCDYDSHFMTAQVKFAAGTGSQVIYTYENDVYDNYTAIIDPLSRRTMTWIMLSWIMTALDSTRRS